MKQLIRGEFLLFAPAVLYNKQGKTYSKCSFYKERKVKNGYN